MTPTQWVVSALVEMHRDPLREVFANRTLNMRSVAAIGYDMDYTLIHYRTHEWESAAFEHAVRVLAGLGWPVGGLTFRPDDHLQGLVIDLETGNLVKATRFGYVIQAHHGTSPLSFDEVRTAYAAEYVDLAEPRWQFLNTMFSLSEASLYGQLVDRLDAGELPSATGIMDYDDLYVAVRSAIDESHARGALKAQIVADPDRFVELDDDVADTLADQRAAGKKLLLVTNSEWAYAQAMMAWCFDRSVPTGTWRDLFDVVVVSAAKPRFFAEQSAPFLVVDEDQGLLAPHRGPYEPGAVYHGGSARLVETSLGLAGNQILYVGDHLFGDVHMSKATLRWRTALIMREIEDELEAAVSFAPREASLRELMVQKADVEDVLAKLRMSRIHQDVAGDADAVRTTQRSIDRAVSRLRHLDDEIAPLARESAGLGNATWGRLMRAGNDKSLFARQVERHADIYTSRVSNLGLRTPFAYFRAARTSLPHDPI